MGVSCVRDAEGGGERSEPPALPCGHYEGDRYYESSIKRLKIAITKEQECHKDCSPSIFYIKVLTNVLKLSFKHICRSDSEARSSPT
ncbi:MAG: hypothetical protein N3F62_05455, partial [Bacteroidia bacterium]|nr:hypothetical protein [Bacteroidia bacterium]